MAYNKALEASVEGIVKNWKSLEKKKMFGGVCFLRHGLMFAGVTDTTLMARVGKSNYEDSLAREHVRVMDFTGKLMAGYVFIDEPGIATEAALKFWLDQCLKFVATLPPKAKK